MHKRLVDPDKLCMGCMAQLEQTAARCPHCGFEEGRYQRRENSLPLREILNGKYLTGRTIGSGGFGITYIGWDFYQCKKVCIKEYFPRTVAERNPRARSYSESISVTIQSSTAMYTHQPEKVQYAYVQGLKNYIQEAENLSRFYLMPGIVSVRDFFYGNNTAYIVMEYIDGIDLKQYVKYLNRCLKPEELFPLLKDVLKALNEVHKVNLIHRDISPDNIMLTRQGKAKLIDFGASKNYGNSGKGPILLKKGYAPIEQYSRDGIQGPWTDIYSICASIYYLLAGIRIPVPQERMEKDTVAPLQKMGVRISEAKDQAIQKGLSIEGKDRYQTMAGLYHDLYGEFV